MHFSQVPGHQHLQSHLLQTLQTGRVAHSQLFVGQAGSGLLPLVLGYVRALLSSQFEEGTDAFERQTRMVDELSHPDLHFAFPVNTNDAVKKHAVSDLFADEWRLFVQENPFGTLYDWALTLGIENKQALIGVREAEEISKKLALTSYEGGYKVLIVWMAEKMNRECANKMLKLIEEPQEKTVVLLLTENESQLLTTIRSRCQKLNVPLLSENDLSQVLVSRFNIDSTAAAALSRRAQGDLNKALQMWREKDLDRLFESWFIQWVRTAFKAKGNKQSVQELLHWSESMGSEPKETQKTFIQYCIELFRQALLKNYQADDLVYLQTEDSKFSIERFAPFVHQNNIFEIIQALEEAHYHISRNANSKILFSELSIQLTRLIHRKEVI